MAAITCLANRSGDKVGNRTMLPPTHRCAGYGGRALAAYGHDSEPVALVGFAADRPLTATGPVSAAWLARLAPISESFTVEDRNARLYTSPGQAVLPRAC